MRINTAESGLSDGTVVTTTNSDDGSAGDAWSAVSGSPTFSTAAARNGSLGYRIPSGTGSTHYLEWTGENSLSLSAEFWVKIVSVPAGTQQRLTAFRNTTNCGGAMILEESGSIKIGVMQSTSLIVATKSGALTVGNWYRVSIAFKNGLSSTGYAYLEVRDSSLALVHSWSGAVSGANSDNLTGMRIGRQLSSADFGGNLDLDDIRLDPRDTILPTASSTGTAASTVTAGTWSPVGAASVHAALADESDSTYAESVDSPADAAFTVAISPMNPGPLTITSRLSASTASPTITMTVTLLQGASTQIAQWTHVVTTTPTDYQYQLTSMQNGAITNREDLRLVYSADAA